jgi:CTD nuclear envelope phosphatase 1
MAADEQTPLLGEAKANHFGDVKISRGWRTIPKRISTAVVGTIRVVITAVAAPGRYVVACFFDDEGRFSPLLPAYTIYRVLNPKKRRRSAQPLRSSEKPDPSRNKDRSSLKHQKRPKRPPSVAPSSTAVATDSEFDEKLASLKTEDRKIPIPMRKSSLPPEGDEIAPARRSIRIKLHNEEVLSKRRKQQEEATARAADPSKDDAKEVVAASLKSPSSPGVSKLTKFPRTPAPPRPLIPRRQPSYSSTPSSGPHQKTLIIDLDETLIHSHSKGGRFATGHMVEVKISHSMGVGGTYIGPQVPILYYVHKRPHCDEFLRKVGSNNPSACPGKD